eukprot:CAMPEP_0170512346 /NCGR_PEP_ID=MMETSP0208-20121228/66799_1 /TAXON_ID=197538 /ORGANISM="Strombidium inclinatum, Strain S3" /LENGTH=59 /DNA_ID=CAMNT_0010795965 /DNA_START=520 /DNA_END=699 /DNA_ORIENTATION=-
MKTMDPSITSKKHKSTSLSTNNGGGNSVKPKAKLFGARSGTATAVSAIGQTPQPPPPEK